MYGIFGRVITIHTVIYGVHIQFWPTLHTAHTQQALCSLSTMAWDLDLTGAAHQIK
jgi:hypothetical protein